MTSPATSPLLTVEESADYLRCSVSHLNKLRIKGGGPVFTKPGKRVLYRPDELDRFLDRKSQKSTADTRRSNWKATK
jgi:excisionase family DNA binding protein